MVYNAKDVVDLTRITFSTIFTVPDCVFSGMGEVEEKHLCFKKNAGMPADDWQIRFGDQRKVSDV